MPVVTLTDITPRPTPGKQVTYIDKSLKGFGVRVTAPRHPPDGNRSEWSALDRVGSGKLSNGYRDSARETASAASDAGMNSLSGRFGNGTNPKSR